MVCGPGVRNGCGCSFSVSDVRMGVPSIQEVANSAFLKHAYSSHTYSLSSSGPV